MGLADRDYYRQAPQRGGSMSRLTPVVKALLIINATIFILDNIVLAPAIGYPPILNFGAFSINSAILSFHLWEFFTFQFLHGGFLHILFNSIAIYYFGPFIERQLGSRRFLNFYLICGAGGAIFYTLISYLGVIPLNTYIPLVGASAGIYGIFVAVAVIAPNLRVQLLFPPIELTMRQLAVALLGIAVLYILFNLRNAGGEAGHLGGAIAGYLLMRCRFLTDGAAVTSQRPRAFRRRWESKLNPRKHTQIHQDTEVDAILDKVSREGFQSLTEDEKAVLKRAAEK